MIDSKVVKITERGWPGHYILAIRCLFRRNTLVEGPNDSVIVSTVGAMASKDGKRIEPMGIDGLLYETKVFGVHREGAYLDPDVEDERSFEINWRICASSNKTQLANIDNIANDMHEAVVAEFAEKVATG